MKYKFWYAVLACALLLQLGCKEDPTLAPVLEQDPAAETLAKIDGAACDREAKDDLIIMTRNIYVGADVDAVLAAPMEQVPLKVAEAYQMLFATNFNERAATLADEIKRNRPHLVGLQEVSTIRMQAPGDLISGGTTPATEVVFDYLAILMAALRARGLHYNVAGIIQNADVEVPMVVSPVPEFNDVRLTDYDVVLVRHDVRVSQVVQANYQARLIVPSMGVEIPRGYVALTARFGKKSVRFVSTHLEPAPIPDLLPIQQAQAGEFMALLAHENLPVILVGDLNTQAETGATYQYLAAQGFADAWLKRSNRGETQGNTCCHAYDLRNVTIALDQRIDFILLKTAQHQRAGDFDFGRVQVLGDELSERTASGMWPSDHAGVVARMHSH